MKFHLRVFLGIVQRVDYISDALGFRVAATNLPTHNPVVNGVPDPVAPVAAPLAAPVAAGMMFCAAPRPSLHACDDKT